MESLSLKQLTLKTLALIALSSSDRGQSLHLANIRDIEISDDCIKFLIKSRIKTTRKTLKPSIVSCTSSTVPELDVAKYVSHYMSVTEPLRQEGCIQLFISWKTFKAISRPSLARWLKDVLSLSGIDTSIYKGHSSEELAFLKLIIRAPLFSKS